MLQATNGKAGRLMIATLAIVATLVAGGCRSNLGNAVAVATGHIDLPTLQAAAERRHERIENSGTTLGAVNQASFSPAAAASTFPAVDSATGNPTPNPSRDEAMAAILPELQRLAAVNPAAQARLLAQLQTADPVHWPALVRRVRADLKVNQQLTQSPDTTTGGSTDELRQPLPQGSASRPPTINLATFELPPAPPEISSQVTTAGYDEPHVPRDFPVHQVAHREPGTFDPPPMQRQPMPSTQVGVVRQTSSEITNPHFNQAYNQPAGTLKPTARALSPKAGRLPPKVIHNPMATVPDKRLTWRDALQQAITDLDARAPKKPLSADESYQHARLRLMQLAAGDLDGAAEAIPGLSSTEQSYWSYQLFALARMMDDQSQPDTRRRASAANLHLSAAAAELEQLSTLAVRSLTFCNEVLGFGVYDPLDDPVFAPGAAATLYAEVRHYQSDVTEEGRHVAALASSYKIVDQNGNRIASSDLPLVEDDCQSRRRDFHIMYVLPVPADIVPGEYRLELSVEDQLGHKRGYASASFRVE